MPGVLPGGSSSTHSDDLAIAQLVGRNFDTRYRFSLSESCVLDGQDGGGSGCLTPRGANKATYGFKLELGVPSNHSVGHYVKMNKILDLKTMAFLV